MILHCILSLFSIYSNPKDSCVDALKIFRTYQDFSNKKFNDVLCPDDKKNKVRINYNFIILKQGNIRHTYPNSEVWATKKEKYFPVL